MADDKIKFQIDLDIKEFTEQGLKAKGILEGLSEKKNLEGLIDGLTQTTAVLGTLGTAAFAFKKAIDFTEEGEKIRQVERQFATLSAQAGIASHELKEGLEGAAKGLITTGDLLEIANKSMISMGSSAAKLPQILELARKATAVYGGDVKTNFENLNQALANGNTRMLKQYGLIIDTEKATRAYAEANGLAANELSEVGKRQAILNETLSQGQKNFKGIDSDLNSTTNTLTLLKNTFSETAEVFILAFEKTMGPAVRSFLGEVKTFAGVIREELVTKFGEGLEQNNIEIKRTEEHLKALEIQMLVLKREAGEGEQGFFSRIFEGDRKGNLEELNKSIEQTTQKLDALRAKNEELKGETGGGGAGPSSDESQVSQTQHLENEKKFQAEMLAIRKDRIDQEALLVQSFADINDNIKERQLMAEQVHQQKLQDIQNSTAYNAIQKEALIAAENQKFNNQKITDENKLNQERITLLNNYQRNSKTAFDGISRSFQVSIQKQTAEHNDWGKQGQKVFDSFEANAVGAFTAMGKAAAAGQNVAEAAAKAVGATILGTIGDKAIAEGSFMLLQSIWPPNPLGLAAGAGLIALGGSLKAVSGGLTSSMGGGGTGPKAGATPDQDPCPMVNKIKTCTVSGTGELPEEDTAAKEQKSIASSAEPDMPAMEKRHKAVNIQIAGHYFDTDTTRRQLMEMIRSETDSTDFTYSKIGVG